MPTSNPVPCATGAASPDEEPRRGRVGCGQIVAFFVGSLALQVVPAHRPPSLHSAEGAGETKRQAPAAVVAVIGVGLALPFVVAVDPVADPTSLYRIRDGAYAADLLIAAVAEFDLFSWLADHGPTSVDFLCSALGLANRPADVLLTLCAAYGLINRDVAAGDVVTLSELGRVHLAAGSPFDLRAYYSSLAERPAVQELAQVLRTDGQAAWASAKAHTLSGGTDWSNRLGDKAFAERITAAMDARGAFLAPGLAHAIADLPISRLLDVGGSSGIYAAELLQGRPGATGAVFERSPVDLAARTLLQARGQADRLGVITGDMFTDPFPSGYDAHLYSQVLHDWDRPRVEQLLLASFVALEPGGWLIDHDTHIEADKRGPLPVAEYSVLLMHSTPGKCWSVRELAEIAQFVGFGDIAHRPAAGDRTVLFARKPARANAPGVGAG